MNSNKFKKWSLLSTYVVETSNGSRICHERVCCCTIGPIIRTYIVFGFRKAREKSLLTVSYLQVSTNYSMKEDYFSHL